MNIKMLVGCDIKYISFHCADGYSLVVLTPIAVFFAGMETHPSANTGEWIFLQDGLHGLFISSFACKIEELRDRVSGRTYFLTGGRHKCSLRFFKTPFSCFNPFLA